MKLAPHTIKNIRRAGALLLIAGAIPLAWLFYKFQDLPNYVRLAAMIPFSFGVPMFSVNDYFDGWSSLGPREKGRSVAWLFAPLMISVGTVLWYLNDPSAKA